MKQIKFTGGVVLCFLFAGMFLPIGFSFAQTSPVTVRVSTDKTSYTLGEPVVMTITAVNNSDKGATLNFSSSKQTDYVIDGKFRWSSDKFFLTVLTERTIPAHGEYAWTMTHKNSDYSLTTGSHTITGEVVGYGSASIQITVGSTQPVAPLTITTTSLPSGTVDASYSTTISASGGSGSYSWSLASGILPPGLSLIQGVCIAVVGPCQAPAEISGTPATAGNYTFTILVSDGTSKVSKEFTITVIPIPKSPQVRYFRYEMSSLPNEWFIVKMTNPATIKQALDDLKGARRLIVSGIVNSGNGGFNSPWSWHLNPATIILGESFIEVCDARPSYVEAHLAEWLGQRYCPWGARIAAVYDAPPTSTISIQPTPIPPATPIVIQVQVNALNVRQDGTLSASKIGLVRQGEILTKLEEKSGWVKVQLPNNQIGWVFGQYIAPATTTPAISTSSQKVVVTAWVLNIRSGPGVNNKIITTVQRNVVLEKVEEKSGWVRVTLLNGQSGWVYGKFVK